MHVCTFVGKLTSVNENTISGGGWRTASPQYSVVLQLFKPSLWGDSQEGMHRRAKSRNFPIGQKDYRDISLLKISTSASSKGKTKLSVVHEALAISVAFAPVLERMPFKYPPLRVSLVVGNPCEDKYSSRSAPSYLKTIQSGNS